MPCIVKRLTSVGLVPVDYSADSLAAAAQYEPNDGVYTVTNTFGTDRVLKLGAHWDRLEDSARRANIPLKLDRPRLQAALRQLIDEAGFGSVRFRVTVSAEAPDEFILSVEPFKPLAPEVYETGIRVITSAAANRENPAAKTTAWMHDRAALETALPPGVFTAILISEDGALLEGTSSNFYAILNGELRTAGEGVLPGIAQQVVFEVAPSILPVRREAVKIGDIPRIEEAFITSASRGIVPIVEMDGMSISGGAPGETTRKLRAAYLMWVDDHMETL